MRLQMPGTVCVMLLNVLLLCWGCSTSPGPGGMTGNDNSTAGNDNSGGAGNDNSAAGGNDNGGSGGGLPFRVITGNEEMVEGSRFDEPNGSTSQRDERFTSTFSLTPVTAVESQAFVDNELVEVISGDLEGTGHLTYQESGTEFDPELECPNSSYSGSVEWDINVTGSYLYIPSLGSIQLTTRAESASSPEYTVAFTNPGCPEFDSTSPSQYVWQGPGQGVWGFVDIVLQNGQYDNSLENPLFDDLGEEDFYRIHAEAGGL